MVQRFEVGTVIGLSKVPAVIDAVKREALARAGWIKFEKALRTTIYFDTERNEFSEEGNAGKRIRRQARFRTYENNFQENCFLELKLDIGSHSKKLRLQMPFHLIEACLKADTCWIEKIVGEIGDEEFTKNFWGLELKPVIAMRYFRHAFECDQSEASRITIDTDISNWRIKSLINSIPNRKPDYSENIAVLEIKSNDSNELKWVTDVLNSLSIDQNVKFSKFLSGSKNLY